MEASKCFPLSCMLPADTIYILGHAMYDKLRAKMHEVEIAAAHLEQPAFLDRMREVTCRRCNMVGCQHNFKNVSAELEIFQCLMKGKYADRIERTEIFLVDLVTPQQKELMIEKGVKLSTHQMPSLKNAQIFVSMKRGEQRVTVSCEIGKRRLWLDAECEALTSLEQVRQKIDKAIAMFV